MRRSLGEEVLLRGFDPGGVEGVGRVEGGARVLNAPPSERVAELRRSRGEQEFGDEDVLLASEVLTAAARGGVGAGTAGARMATNLMAELRARGAIQVQLDIVSELFDVTTS